MSTGERFNTMGSNRRDCPRCYRVGTLSGLREGDHPTLTCTGCRAAFSLTWAAMPGEPDTLTQLPVVDPPRKPDFLLTLTPSRPGARK
jgi:hypothetical protein